MAAGVDFQLPPKIITPRNGYFIRPLSGHRRRHPLFTFHGALVLYFARTRKVTAFSVSRVRPYTYILLLYIIYIVLRARYYIQGWAGLPPLRNPYKRRRRFIAAKYYIL